MILIFSVPKSQNSNEEEKNSITAKAYVSNLRDTNITAHDEDMIF